MTEPDKVDLFQEIGKETGCLGLARDFYSRVADDPELRVLFPGKSFRCATEELAAFLVQFFDGDESRMQYRWWLSLRESHARFRIGESQRASWLGHMNSALDTVMTNAESRAHLRSLFEVASSYIVDSHGPDLANSVLGELWHRQHLLDLLMDAIAAGRDAEAIALADHHTSRRSVFVGILARMMKTGREPLIGFALESLERDARLAGARFNGRFLIHFAAGFGCLPVLSALLASGASPNVQDQGGHTPLYRVANECWSDVGTLVVCELVRHGALVDHSGGVTRSTALHAAARRGHLAVAMALVDAGASMDVRDTRGFTPLDRARNCRKPEVAAALQSRMGS